MYVWLLIGVVVGGVFGYALSSYLIAKDPSVIHILDDEVVVKKPANGLVLVAAPPDVVRKLVVQKDIVEEKSSVEARELYRRKK